MLGRVRRLLDRGLGAGLVAGFAAALAMVALRFAIGAPSLQELIVDKLLSFLPPRAFEFLLQRFYELGKPLAVLGTTLLLTFMGGLVGLAFGWGIGRAPGWARRWWLLSGLLFGLGLWVLLSVAMTPLLGGGFWGARVPGGAAGFSLASFIATCGYGLILSRLMRPAPEALGPDAATPAGMTRRAFLGRAALWIVAIGAVGFGVRALVSGAGRLAGSRVSTRDAGILPPEVTPTERFYKVSKNFVDPEVDGRSWRLHVTGMVDRAMTLTLDELRALPAVERYQTLECVSNPVGGDLISNAIWKGVPLRDLLQSAGLKPNVARVTFRSADGYTESLPLDDAVRPEILIAYEMNGEPLPSDHGFPARVLIPDRYGMKGPKWLEEIGTTGDKDYRGYWEERGWDDRAEVKTTSQALVPADGTVVPVEAAVIGGIAFSGAKGIAQVEVSADGGKTWRKATLKPALSPYTWVLWTAEWKPPAPGRYKLTVRAEDASGIPQISAPHDPAPSGATGYHTITVQVT